MVLLITTMSLLTLYDAEICLHKLWRPKCVFFRIEIIIKVLDSSSDSFEYLRYDYKNCFNPFYLLRGSSLDVRL